MSPVTPGDLMMVSCHSLMLCLCLVSSLTNGDKIMGRDLSVMTTMATIPHNEPWLAVIDTD